MRRCWPTCLRAAGLLEQWCLACMANGLQVMLALGGKKKIVRLLHGRLHLSWHYTQRLADVEATHKTLGPQVSCWP